MKNIYEQMRVCPLFAGIEDKDLESLLACMGAKPRWYEKGEVILSEGDEASELGVVLSGSAQVMRMDYDGNRSIMTHLEAGDMFAEAFVCAGVKYMPVQVVATEKTQVLLLDGARLTTTCTSACGFHHRMIYNLMRILATKNLACNQKIDIVSKRTTREKLLTYLWLQSQRVQSHSFVIPYNRQELADYLGVERSGLSTEIGKLRAEGVLESEKNRFTLLKM